MPQTGLPKQQKFDSFQFWGLEVKDQGVGRVGFTLRLLSLASRVQFTSVAQLCSTLCDPMDCSTPSLPDYHQLPEFTQTHVHWVRDAIQPSHPVVPFSSFLHSFPASESFPVCQLFPFGGQSNRASAATLQHLSFQWITWWSFELFLFFGFHS